MSKCLNSDREQPDQKNGTNRGPDLVKAFAQIVQDAVSVQPGWPLFLPAE